MLLFKSQKLSLKETAMTSRSLVFLAMVGLSVLPAPAAAQRKGPPLRMSEVPEATLPQELADGKLLAKAEREASLSTSQEIAQAKVAVARGWREARFTFFVAGKVTASSLDDARAAKDAMLAVAAPPEKRLAALMEWWLVAWVADEIYQAKYARGSIGESQALETRYQRLEAEEALLQAAKGMPDAAWLAVVPNRLVVLDDEAPWAIAALGRKDLKTLAAEKLKTAQDGWEAHFRAFVTGRTIPDFLLPWARRLVAAQAAVDGPPSAVRAGLAKVWQFTLAVEQSNQVKYDARSIAITQFAQTIYARCHAAFQWHQSGGTAEPLSTGEVMDSNLAKAEWAMVHQKPEQFTQGKLAAARLQMEGRFKEFIAGKTNAEFLRAANEMLWEAESAVAATKAARQAASRRYWKAAWLCEEINRAKYEAGSIAITQYLQLVYQRLDAQWLWAKARED
jgi:hypothetical protein